MKHKSTSKIISFALAAVLALGIFPITPHAPVTAQAAMPTSAAGQPYDGVDFAALSAPGNGIYYGTYKHTTSLAYGTFGPATLDATATPILWRVMGEEANDNAITLMSEYVLDSKQFRNTTIFGSNEYNTSDIRAWLNADTNPTDFMKSFSTAEKSDVCMRTTDVVTGMYTDSGNETVGTHFYSGYNWTSTSTFPLKATGDRVYLPWVTAYNNSVFWTAGNNVSQGKISSNTGRLKNGSAGVTWWFRSPESSTGFYVMYATRYGTASYDIVNIYNGVRPAFKLNPSSVIFASEIGGSGAGSTAVTANNYAAGASGKKNFKLTVMDASLSLTGLRDGGSNNVTPTTTLAITFGGSIALTGTGTTGTNLTYKIVDSGHNIVGYGQDTTNTGVTVSAKNLAGRNLAAGSYTVYVWAQKNETINSNTGSAPQYFTITVDPPPNNPPTVRTGESTQSGAATAAARSGNPVAIPYTGDVSSWFEDADGDTLTYAIVSTDANGTVNLNAVNGTLTYTPTAAASGATKTIVVKAKDGTADSIGNVTISITVGAVPATATGAPGDGVDFAALSAPGNGIYYGTYDHTANLSNGNWGSPTYEGVKTPILWRVMGEESNDNAITLMSEYVLDSKQFINATNNGANEYNTSGIRAWLNADTNPTDFMKSFSTAEKSDVCMSATDIVTGMYDRYSGTEKVGTHYYRDSNWTSASTFPLTTPQQDKVYLLWAIANNNSVYWTAGNNVSEGKMSDSYSNNIAKLKNGSSAVYWWLRTPDDNFPDHALSVFPSGIVTYDHVLYDNGVRPAFKLNPSSVIFASEIGGSIAGSTAITANNYAAGASGKKNFKLTVMDASLSLTELQDRDSNSVTSSTTLTTSPGGSIALTGTGTTGTNQTYKIVDSGHNIVGYGQDTTNTALTVTAKDFAGVNLADGSYTVYVWAQKNETINSNTGSAPAYFTMTVASPSLPDVKITRQVAESVEGSNKVSFDVMLDAPEIGVLYVAVYAGGKLLAVKHVNIDDAQILEESFEFTVPIHATYTIKAFYWEKDSLKPYCKNDEKTVSGV